MRGFVFKFLNFCVIRSKNFVHLALLADINLGEQMWVYWFMQDA